MKNILIVILWICLLSSTLVAQETDFNQQYRNGKEFYITGKYSLAMDVLQPLTLKKSGHPYGAYASFYYALAAYKSNYLPLSRNMLLQIKTRYKSWNKLDEVNYWLGIIYMEEGKYSQALDALGKVKNKSFNESISGLKQKYLTTIEDEQELQELFELNPNEPIPGYLVAKNIANKPLVDQDRKRLNEIIDQFQFDPSEFNVIEMRKSIFKDSYQVAVLLPFMIDKLEPNLKRKVNQFVLDLYQGLLLSADTLKTQGINIKLHAYDTKRSKRITEEIVRKEEMKGMDLIIGPLFPQPIAVVNEFSYKNNINVVSPLSSDAAVIDHNPFAFLFYPSNETTGRASAEWVINQNNKKPGIIFYEDNPNDSAMAFAYKQRIEADSISIIKTKKIGKDNSQEILDMLLLKYEQMERDSTEEVGSGYIIPLDSLGHIFVASGNDLISSKVLSAVETRGDDIMVIGSADWLNLASIRFDTYRKLGVILYAPNYNALSSRSFKAFQQQYLIKYHDTPDRYAQIGFELMYIMGQSLDKYGKYFQIGWRNNGFMKGHMTTGFDYSNSNDNKVVPFLQFEEDDITIRLNND